jgi:peroxiredoxin
MKTPMNKKSHRANRSTSSLWAISAGVAALGIYVLLSNSGSTATGALKPSLPLAEISGAAPAFTLPDLKGVPVSLASLRGKVVVLDFWATWCPPCRREIPDFISLQSQYGAKGLQVVGVALDEPEAVKAFAAQSRMNYPVLLGTDDIARMYGGITGIPTTFIIDKSGKIVNRFEGFRPKEVFEKEILKLLQ